MSIYIAQFADCPGEVKIGKSSNVKKRLPPQIDEHGSLILFEEYVGESDHTTELHLKRSLWVRGQGNSNNDTKSGATEFYKIDKIPSGIDHFRQLLHDRGYIKTHLSASDFRKPSGSARGKYICHLEKTIKDLKKIDSVILTWYLTGIAPSTNMSDFTVACSKLGQNSDWCSLSMLKTAKHFASQWPYGILSNDFEG